MKKVISACIYQLIQFDTKEEYEDYIFKLKKNKQKFKVESVEELKNNKIKVKIMKQYNKNKFIEGGNTNEG